MPERAEGRQLMQVYILIAVVVGLVYGAWALYDHGYETAGTEYRLAASERLREAHEQSEARAATERAGRAEAERQADEAEARGEELAAQVEAMRQEPDPELCPAMCYVLDWKGESGS